VKIRNKEGLSLVLWWIGLTFSIGFLLPFVTALFKTRSTPTTTTLLTAETPSSENVASGLEEQEAQPTSPANPFSPANSSKPVKEEPSASPFPVPVSGPAEVQKKINSQTPSAGNIPRNPYIKLMKAQKEARERNLAKRNQGKVYDEGELNKTLQSIHSGKVDPGQAKKRNLYFEKLSNQLKDLQGKNQPNVEPEGEEPDLPAVAEDDKGGRFADQEGLEGGEYLDSVGREDGEFDEEFPEGEEDFEEDRDLALDPDGENFPEDEFGDLPEEEPLDDFR